ncbi:MAG: integration host factor subunit alpha [Deltaproteobacteria bacterium]|nr:integration host factor subunit alpha [Deltaproteobacteria bacterium]
MVAGCLTKADLVDAIYETLPMDKHKASQIVEDWIELIKEGLDRDNKVMISGFGVFEVKSKHARPGRNPQTGDRITLDARKVVKFKPSQILRSLLNKDFEQEAKDDGF